MIVFCNTHVFALEKLTYLLHGLISLYLRYEWSFITYFLCWMQLVCTPIYSIVFAVTNRTIYYLFAHNYISIAGMLNILKYIREIVSVSELLNNSHHYFMCVVRSREKKDEHHNRKNVLLFSSDYCTNRKPSTHFSSVVCTPSLILLTTVTIAIADDFIAIFSIMGFIESFWKLIAESSFGRVCIQRVPYLFLRIGDSDISWPGMLLYWLITLIIFFV